MMDNTTNYLLLIICFSVVILIICDKSTEKYQNENQNENENENENEMKIKDYINDNTDNLLKQKHELELNSNKEQLKNLQDYKDGLKNRELKHGMEIFNSRLNELLNVNTLEDSEIRENISNYIDNIDISDKDIYNNHVLEYYKTYKTQITNDEQEFNKQFSKIDTHETFDTTVNNDNKLALFIGKYFIIPYQYKEFNNIYMILTKDKREKRNTEGSGETYNMLDDYILGFYVLDELIVDYSVKLYKKNDTLLNLFKNIETSPEELKKNLSGYEIEIQKENAVKLNQTNFPKSRSAAKNMLNMLGIKEGSNIYIFKSEPLFNKQYINPNSDVEGVTKENFFYKDTDDNFKIYNKTGTTLLQLTKKNESVDKPFASLS
jgi:hypothetical protein